MGYAPRAAVLALLVVVSGLAGGAVPAVAQPERAPPADPPDDAIGWENGYWHNESLAINRSDGIDEGELDAVVARTMARVEQIRRLEFNETVPVSVRSREDFRENVGGGKVDEERRVFDNAKFEAALLVGETEDSVGTQRANRGSSVLAYYSSAGDRIVLITPNGTVEGIDEVSLAHELTHALQDQRFNYPRLYRRNMTRDDVNGVKGIIEGDAYYVDHRYEERCDDPGHAWNGTCVSPQASGGGGGGDGGPANWGVVFLKKPYVFDGASFVAERRAAGGWEAVDAVYEEAPESFEQVAHPGKYPEEEPVEVALEDRTGEGWERVRPPGRPDHGEVGQAGIAAMLVYPLYHSEGQTRIVSPRDWFNYTPSGGISRFDPVNFGFAAAEGWGGDRLHVYRNAANETGYVWRIVWDTPADAAEFLETYRLVLGYWGAEEVAEDVYRIPTGEFADAFRVTHAGDTVTIVNAPSVEGLDEVRRTATPTPATATDGTTAGTANVTATGTMDGTLPRTTVSEYPTVEQPGFGPLAALVALALSVLVARRRG